MPWSSQAFTRATAKSVPVWNEDRGLSSPWNRQGWELEGLGGVPQRAASQGAWLEGRGCLLWSQGYGARPCWASEMCSRGGQDPLRLLFQKKTPKCLVINNSRVSEALSKFTCKDVHKTLLPSGSTEVSEWEAMLVCREQSPKEINLYFCQAGSFPGPHKQLREGGGCSAMDREELHPDVDLAGSRQICAMLWAGSGQRYGPGISSRWEQLLGCYPQLWKLCLVFIPSDTSLPPSSKHLATPNLGFLSFFFFANYISLSFSCGHGAPWCTGAALCPALSKGATWGTRKSLEMKRKNKELPRRPKKMQLAQEAKSQCKPQSWVCSDGH